MSKDNRNIGSSERAPKPAERKDPAEKEIPENDPPSKRKGPIEDPGHEEPLIAPTDPETEKQGEMKL